jgi:hypothetical protein
MDDRLKSFRSNDRGGWRRCRVAVRGEQDNEENQGREGKDEVRVEGWKEQQRENDQPSLV